MHIDTDTWGWRERAVAIGIITGTLIVLALLASTDRAGATSADLCTAWSKTCTSSRMIFGIRVCTAWRLTCVSGAPASGRIAGLAAPAAGNRGGCGRHNMTTVTCNVSDAGSGFVSGECEQGYWFSRVSTARTFVVGQIVTARGCEGLNQELYAPIRISK